MGTSKDQNVSIHYSVRPFMLTPTIIYEADRGTLHSSAFVDTECYKSYNKYSSNGIIKV